MTAGPPTTELRRLTKRAQYLKEEILAMLKFYHIGVDFSRKQAEAVELSAEIAALDRAFPRG